MNKKNLLLLMLLSLSNFIIYSSDGEVSDNELTNLTGRFSKASVSSRILSGSSCKTGRRSAVASTLSGEYRPGSAPTSSLEKDVFHSPSPSMQVDEPGAAAAAAVAGRKTPLPRMMQQPPKGIMRTPPKRKRVSVSNSESDSDDDDNILQRPKRRRFTEAQLERMAQRYDARFSMDETSTDDERPDDAMQVND